MCWAEAGAKWNMIRENARFILDEEKGQLCLYLLPVHSTFRRTQRSEMSKVKLYELNE